MEGQPHCAICAAWLCGRRRKRCRKCDHRYSPDEYPVLACPTCGEDRHCKNEVKRAGDACRRHGGNAPKGMAHPNWKTGRYSRYAVPDNMLQDYIDFLADPERLALDHEIALVRAVLQDRVKELQRSSSTEAWRLAASAYRDILLARQWKQPEREKELFERLGEILSKGAGLAETRKEILRHTEAVRKLTDTQRQLYVDQGEFITRGMALVMFNRFLEAVKDNVQALPGGAEALARIATAVASMAGRMGQPRLATGGGQPPPP